MKVNRYDVRCKGCGLMVFAGSGQIVKENGKWAGYHHSCANVITVRFSSGETMTQNKNGRCIDAPCCGCCT